MKDFYYFTGIIAFITIINLVQYKYPEFWIRLWSKKNSQRKIIGLFSRYDETKFIKGVSEVRRKIKVRMSVLIVLYLMILISQFVR